MRDLTTEAVTSPNARSRLAAGYVARGWRVLPTRGRVPIVKDWENLVLDQFEARDAWHPKGEWGGFNIGLATGPSGLVVVDLDQKNGKDGAGQWARLLEELEIDPPETYTVQTPSGGWHHYFQAPPGVEIRLSASQVADGVDIRAWGGMVVAAGSEIDGRPYRLVDDRDPIALPPELTERLLHLPGSRSKPSPAERIPQVIPQGERETVLVSLAGTMRRRGASPEAIRAAIEAENEIRCEPPLEFEALDRIANSVGRYDPENQPLGFDPTGEIEIDPILFEKQVVTLETMRRAQEVMKTRNARRIRDVLGGMEEPMNVLKFLEAGPDPVATCIWGFARPGGVMGWAANQGLIIAGPPGTGKSTIALQVVLRRVGILEGEVLGMPVLVEKRPLVYLALDRADQIRQSVRRMLPEDADPEAVERLQMLDALPHSVDLRRPETFIAWLQERDASAVVLDSAKDLGFDLNDSSEGQAFNFLVQATLRAGIQVFVLHHSRKVPRGDKKPLTLNDLHGSQWVAAGAGSVIMLDGVAGPDPKRMVHVKPLTVPMPPLLLTLDPETGEIGHSEDVGDSEDDDAPTNRRGDLQRRLLRSLGEEGAPLTNSTLATITGSSSGAVSRALRTLEQQGAVTRTPAGWERITAEL